MPEISPDQLARLQQHDPETIAAPALDRTREVPVWEREDAPPGSTEQSLLVHENGVPVRVAGPTHYHHTADGRVHGGYGIGTHYSEADPDGGPDRVVPIIGIYGG